MSNNVARIILMWLANNWLILAIVLVLWFILNLYRYKSRPLAQMGFKENPDVGIPVRVHVNPFSIKKKYIIKIEEFAEICGIRVEQIRLTSNCGRDMYFMSVDNNDTRYIRVKDLPMHSNKELVDLTSTVTIKIQKYADNKDYLILTISHR